MITGNKLKYLFILPITLFLYSCGGGSSSGSGDEVQSKRAGINEVIVHIGADAQGLNPLTTSDATASQVNAQTHQYLVELDPETYELLPSLVVESTKPEVIEKDGEKVGMVLNYEIRPEATWDNGEPITAYDYIFSLKVVKCPAITETGHIRPYLKFINEVVVDETNPKKFKLICNEVYFTAEYGAGNTIQILPEYAYDPKGLLKNYTIKDFSDPKKADQFKSDKNLIEFAQEYTSEKYQREPEYVVGSGPYKLVAWETGQRIILEKKQDWWGSKIDAKNFEAYPDKITYEVIVEMATSLSAMRDEALDVSKTFSSKIFVTELMEDEKFKSMYNLYTPPYIAFSYVGMNMRSPKLSEKAVRLALTHAYDIEYVNEVFSYGLAERTIGPFHNTQPYYNHDIKPYEFDLDKAKSLLDEAGWVDTDGDGIRDKVVNGAKVQLDLQYKYTPGSATAESILLLYKNNLQEIGVNLELVTREWTIFLDELDSHKFELYSGSWVNDPVPNDPYQLWHTESYNGGSNYCGFGNANSDAIIEAIQKELDEDKRNELYKEFQQILHDEAPYIFLSNPLKKVATHKRFDNAEGNALRVGYVTNAFKLNPSFGTGSKLAPTE